MAGLANDVLERVAGWDEEAAAAMNAPAIAARKWHTVAEAAQVCGEFARSGGGRAGGDESRTASTSDGTNARRRC